MNEHSHQSHQASPALTGCIFCSIVSGKIPCHKIYEDGQVLAFLDVAPLSYGHSLIIPKSHYETIETVPAALAGQCMAVAPRLTRALIAATGAAAWNILQNNGAVAGQEVGHVHFHLIPRAEGDNLGFRWSPKSLTAEDAKALTETVAQALNTGQ